jgi:nucleoside-diphosphate-sugar epimerase
MSKILIIGNQGYIGPILAKHLKSINPDHLLIGLDTGYFAKYHTVQGLNPDHYIDIQYNHDVRDVNEDVFTNVDHIIYLAAISNDPMGEEFSKPTTEINTNSALRIAEIAKKKKVKSFTFASSCSVYGAADGLTARNEESELNPVTTYAKSKIQSEKLLKPLASENFKITCMRFATACGFSPRLRLDLVVNDFVFTALTTGSIKILSNGEPWRPLIDVEDMSRAMEWSISRTQGGNFLSLNVGSNEWNYQIKELADKVKLNLENIGIEINSSAPEDKRSYKVDFSLFKTLAPNHYPKKSIGQTISELKEGIESFSESINSINEQGTTRLKVLRSLISDNTLNNNLFWTK